MLENITIEGLRGFSSPQTITLAKHNGLPGSGLTLLTGPNNSGKSTIIETLKLRASINRNPSFHVGMRNATTDAVSIKYNIGGNTEAITSSRPGNSETVVDRQSNLTPYVVPSRRHFSPYFGKSGNVAREAYAAQFGSNQAMREQVLSGFEGRLFELDENRQDFNAFLLEVIPGFMDWSIDQSESGQYFIKLTSGSKSHSLAGSGDGITSAFVIAAALFDSHPDDVVAIDEPELSLHPSIQKRLASAITRLAADRQIIVSSHSPYFIDPIALKNGAEIIRTWDKPNGVQAFQLSVNSCPALKSLLSSNTNNPHVFGLDAREIFFGDDPIMVFEGQEDVVLWPKIVGTSPQLADVMSYGWGAGGASNMSNVVSVLRALGFQKVAGVLDNNRPQDLANLRAAFPEFRFVELPAADIRSKPAVKERAAVEGILDHSGKVRPEIAAQLDETLAELVDFLDLN